MSLIYLPCIAGPLSSAANVHDPYFSNVVLLCHCETGFTNVVQPLGRGAILSLGSTQTISATNPRYGTGCLDCVGTGTYGASSSSDYILGTGNLTVEFSARTGSPSQTAILLDWRSGDPQICPTLYMQGGAYYYYVNGANRLGPLGTVSTNVYDVIGYSRVGTTGYLAQNGTVLGSWTDTNNYVNDLIHIGANYVNAGQFTGKIDEIRVTKGAGRFSANYAIATGPFSDS